MLGRVAVTTNFKIFVITQPGVGHSNLSLAMFSPATKLLGKFHVIQIIQSHLPLMTKLSDTVHS